MHTEHTGLSALEEAIQRSPEAGAERSNLGRGPPALTQGLHEPLLEALAEAFGQALGHDRHKALLEARAEHLHASNHKQDEGRTLLS